MGFVLRLHARVEIETDIREDAGRRDRGRTPGMIPARAGVWPWRHRGLHLRSHRRPILLDEANLRESEVRRLLEVILFQALDESVLGWDKATQELAPWATRFNRLSTLPASRMRIG